MRNFYLVIIGLLFFTSGFSQTQQVIFDAGSHQWTVPCGVTSITVEAWGQEQVEAQMVVAEAELIPKRLLMFQLI